MNLQVSDLFNVLIAGAANGYALVSVRAAGSSFAGIALAGIVAYAGATILVRILESVFASHGTKNVTDLLAVKSWPKFLIWGAINGIAFALLAPYVVTGTATGILLGTGTYFLSQILAYLMAIS